LKVEDLVKKVVDARSFETAQWGIIRLKGIKVEGLDEEQKQRAVHRLGQLVWREMVIAEVEGREMKSGCEAKVKIGKTDVNQEMKKFLQELTAPK
jgi:hypothetical protein